LGDGVLTPYNYHITLVLLNDVEMESYRELSKEIGKLLAMTEEEPSAKLKDLIRKRNRIVANASGKVSSFSQLLRAVTIEDKAHTLVYVGEGKALDLNDDEFELSQLQAVAQEMLKLGWRVSRFTASESKPERTSIMRDFTTGNIDALVSMRVLDEGVDIPMCKRAFILASTTNSRQFVQRRGRILRKSSGKEYAEIFDFVVVPQSWGKTESCFTELVKRELRRVMEFVRLAKNRADVELEASELGASFNLDVRGL